MLLYEQICRDNLVKYGTEVNRYIQIIISQYSNRTHFIYELLQNAEDAGATYVRFYLYTDRLEMRHNGRPFNERDIVGVCGIADGTKGSEDGMQIGHFGIGFKSVYGYTDSPKIYSGKYHFEIENYLNPKEIPGRNDVSPEETCMVLPFDKNTVTKETAFSEINRALVEKLDAESVIILNNISDIYVEAAGNPTTAHIEKVKKPYKNSNNVFFVSLFSHRHNSISGKDSSTDSNYLFFTDAEKEATAIIFRVDGKELVPIKNSKIYAFFPTAKEAHQNFYIHAPFDTTPARDNFKEGADFGRHNVQLVGQLCRLIRFAFCWLRDNGYLSFKGLSSVYPIFEYEEDDVLYPIYENSVEFIEEGEQLLPINQEGKYKSISEICVPSNMAIVSVFDDTDLQALTSNRHLFWLSKEITTTAYTAFKEFLDKNFKFKTYEWRDLVYLLDSDFLKKKNIRWMELLFSNIESFCIKRIDGQSHYIDTTDIPFVRIKGGDHICAREDGKLQVYLNNPRVVNYHISTDCLQNDTIRGFYERALRIPSYDIEREALDNILPKYDTPDVQFKTNDHIKENIADLKEIKDAIFVNPGIVGVLADKYIVTDGDKWYKPGELYIRSSDARCGYSLVKGIIPIKYLATSYFDDTVMSVRLDDDFFKKIGCNLGIKAIYVDKQDYLKAVKRYCGNQAYSDVADRIFSKNFISGKFHWEFCFEGFPELFSGINKEKSIEIAKFLNRHTQEFDIQGDLSAANDQHFNKGFESLSGFSMLGLILCYEKWIYIAEDPNPHSVLEVEREDLIKEYAQARRLMEMLPFREVKSILTDWIEANYEDKQSQDLIRRILSNPERLKEIAKAESRSEAQRAAKLEKKQSIESRIKGGDRKQQPGEEPNEELEISSISQKAIDNREKKLEEILSESMEHKIKVSYGLSFSARRSNAEEREFLRHEYDGVCQICLKKIITYKNEPYFEAINMIKPSEMLDDYSDSLRLGWNALCLCPNCAAEYNYCSKEISVLYEEIISTEVIPDSDEPIKLDIQMPVGKARSIKYSPRHFMALKKALQVFEERSDK